MKHALVALAVAAIGGSSACCDTASRQNDPPAHADAAAVATASTPPPAPKNLSVAKLTLDDVRAGVARSGWQAKADLSTEFDSCKATQLDVGKGQIEGRVQLYACTDEYDARRRETVVKNSEDGVIEREVGRMLEVIVRGHKDEAQKLFAGILGR